MIQDKTKILNESDLSNITVKQGDLSNLTTDYGSQFNQDIIKSQQEKIEVMRNRTKFNFAYFNFYIRTLDEGGE